MSKSRTGTMPLSGRVVAITGAARGIGAQTARELTQRGARVSLIGLEPDVLATVAAELGPDHAWFEADVTDPTSITVAMEATVEQFGGIDVVVANAGVAPFGTVRDHDPHAFTKTIDVNLNGVFHTVRAALPHVIERRGYVLVVSSLSAFTPVGGMAAYTASKAGAEALASALSSEVSHHGVTVGSAHPSWIDTDLVRDVSADLPSFRAMREKLPWPMHSTTTVADCGRAFAEGIERRARRIYVPRSIMLMHWLRNLPASRLMGRLMRPTTRRLMPQMEREVADLGRSFSARNQRINSGRERDAGEAGPAEVGVAGRRCGDVRPPGSSGLQPAATAAPSGFVQPPGAPARLRRSTTRRGTARVRLHCAAEPSAGEPPTGAPPAGGGASAPLLSRPREC